MRFHVAFLLALLGLSAVASFGQSQATSPGSFVGYPGAPPAGQSGSGLSDWCVHSGPDPGCPTSGAPPAVRPPAGTRAYTYPTAMLRVNQYALATVAFSAEQVGESVRTLPDGTHITSAQSSQLIFRDLLGRTRTERPLATSSNPSLPKLPTVIQILDPIAGVAYLLDAQGKVAHRVVLPPQPAPRNMTPPPNRPYVVSSTKVTVMSDGSQSKSEALGKQVMEGVEVEGQRDTVTSPAGVQGSDQPMTTVTETWTSRELGNTIVLMKRTDPRMGEVTQKLTNVRLGEQAFSLFQPPPDYTVVEETGPSISVPYTLAQVRP